jgi:hypothetical protein
LQKKVVLSDGRHEGMTGGEGGEGGLGGDGGGDGGGLQAKTEMGKLQM